MMDHSYFEDFWKVPGYLGANPPDSLLRARVQYKTTVKKVITAGDPEARTASGGVDTAWQQLKAEAPVGFQLESVPAGDLEEAFLLIKSGDAARQRSSCWESLREYRIHWQQPIRRR